MKLSLSGGMTSHRALIFIQDSSQTDGRGLTGLVWNSPSIAASYVRPGAARQPITLATQTVTGAYSSGGFVQIDATNMPGWYRFDIPDAALASGARSVGIVLRGAANMAQVNLEVQLLNAAVGYGIASGGTLGPPSTITTSALIPATTVIDQFKGRVVIFDLDTATPALRGQAADVTTNTTGGVLTVSALTTAPASGDTFVIV
jgi:hypothetical protein